jgi:hypothetical protein
MQYKQTLRILEEIVGSPGTPTGTVLAAARLLTSSDPMPRLGPYEKRSAAQVLWRLASDSTQNPKARLKVLLKLIDTAPQNHARSANGHSQSPTGDPKDTNTGNVIE